MNSNGSLNSASSCFSKQSNDGDEKRSSSIELDQAHQM